MSVTFTYDLPLAEKLVKAWSAITHTKIGGPATGERGEDFTPGMYLKKGYVITSRGCPNHCWFCSVWRREGPVRELPITEGHNVLDDNLLACSDDHIRAVFTMLKGQKAVEFTGGLEAARLKPWHVEELAKIKPKQLFFAYDTPDDLEPLRYAGKALQMAGFKSSNHGLRAYVLCGYPQDTIDKAETRMHQTVDAGFMPMAMLHRDDTGRRDPTWQKWARLWARPQIMGSKNHVG